MEVVLFQPKIPQNTGNIARTCAVAGTTLTLVRPLGFSLSKRHLRRSGLDYWDALQMRCVDTLDEVLDGPFYFFSSKAKKLYTDISYPKNVRLIFGSETNGLPAKLHSQYKEQFVTLPMVHGRCLNLSNAVAVALYEAWRQLNFAQE